MDANRADKLRLDFVVEFVFFPYAIAFFKGGVLCLSVVGCSVTLVLLVGVLVGLSVDVEGRL